MVVLYLYLSLNGLGGEKVEVVRRWGDGVATGDSLTSMALCQKSPNPSFFLKGPELQFL